MTRSDTIKYFIFFPAFPRLLFQRCCGLALSSNTRSQSSLRAAAQTLLRYISVISYKEKMCLIPVGGSLLIGLIIIVIVIIYVFIYLFLLIFILLLLLLLLLLLSLELFIGKDFLAKGQLH